MMGKVGRFLVFAGRRCPISFLVPVPVGGRMLSHRLGIPWFLSESVDVNLHSLDWMTNFVVDLHGCESRNPNEIRAQSSLRIGGWCTSSRSYILRLSTSLSASIQLTCFHVTLTANISRPPRGSNRTPRTKGVWISLAFDSGYEDMPLAPNATTRRLEQRGEFQSTCTLDQYELCEALKRNLECRNALVVTLEGA